MINLILSAFLSYVERNPAVLERLITLAIDALIQHLETQTPAKA